MIKISEIKQLLNETTNSLRNLCLSSKINIFSKVKPIQSDDEATDDYRKSNHYSLQRKSYTDIQTMINDNINSTDYCIDYIRPTSNYKLFDFVGYNNEAINPAPSSFKSSLSLMVFGDDDAAYRFSLSDTNKEETSDNVGWKDIYYGTGWRRCLAIIDANNQLIDWCSNYLDCKKLAETAPRQHNNIYRVFEFMGKISRQKYIGTPFTGIITEVSPLPVAVSSTLNISFPSDYGWDEDYPTNLPTLKFSCEYIDNVVNYSIVATIPSTLRNDLYNYQDFAMIYSKDINEFNIGYPWSSAIMLDDIYTEIFFGRGVIDTMGTRYETYINGERYYGDTYTFSGWVFENIEYDGTRPIYYFTTDTNWTHTFSNSVPNTDIQHSVDVYGYVIIGLAINKTVVRKIVVGDLNT